MELTIFGLFFCTLHTFQKLVLTIFDHFYSRPRLLLLLFYLFSKNILPCFSNSSFQQLVICHIGILVEQLLKNMASLIAYLPLIKYSLYLIFWHLFGYCKNAYRLFKGTSKISSKKARLHKILFRHKRMPGENTRREDFVTVDDGFIFAEELMGAEWTIYSFDKQGAIFVRMPNSFTHYSIDKYPFIYPHLLNEGIRIAEINLKTFVEFGEQHEEDYKPPKCLYFTNTARSASTLFGSMLQQNGYSTVIGEHPAFTTLALGLRQSYWNEKDINRLITPTIKILRKQISSNHLLIFKVRSCDICLVPFLAENFPEIQHIFMFRKKGLSSVERMISTDPQISLLRKLYILFPYFTRGLTSLMSDSSREFKPKTIKEAAFILYAEPYLLYKKNKELFDFPIVWQDELISETEKVLTPIFEKLKIPIDSCMPHALECLKHDSQDGTFLSQKIMKQYSATELTPDIKELLISYAKLFEMEQEVIGLDE